MIALLVALTAPASAACSRRAEKHACCCPPPRAGTICAPDCCGLYKPAPPAGPSTRLRSLEQPAPPPPAPIGEGVALPSLAQRPAAHALVELHERAAPRLPRRI